MVSHGDKMRKWVLGKNRLREAWCIKEKTIKTNLLRIEDLENLRKDYWNELQEMASEQPRGWKGSHWEQALRRFAVSKEESLVRELRRREAENGRLERQFIEAREKLNVWQLTRPRDEALEIELRKSLSSFLANFFLNAGKGAGVNSNSNPNKNSHL